MSKQSDAESKHIKTKIIYSPKLYLAMVFPFYLYNWEVTKRTFSGREKKTKTKTKKNKKIYVYDHTPHDSHEVDLNKAKATRFV